MQEPGALLSLRHDRGAHTCVVYVLSVCPGRDGGAGAGGVLFWMREEHESVK